MSDSELLAPPDESSGGTGCIEPSKTSPPRVFVGIKITPELAERLAEIAKPLGVEGVRLVPKGDIHLTLVPPWNESDIVEACEKLRQATCGFGCFPLLFENLRYGPTLRHPHLLWAECTASDELSRLRMALLAKFGQTDPRPFTPHVTLARIPKGGRIVARKFPLGQTLSFTQLITSVELFQSPEKGGSGYQVLASLPLGSDPCRAGEVSATLAQED